MKGRIIIIEDERELGELIQLYLSKDGIDSSLCPSAEEGLDLFRRESADLIVLDINLPGMDGFEFLQILRRESTIPVIIVSAREADEDIVMGLGVGADEFVNKPFAPRVLVARIRAMLRRGRIIEPRTLSFGCCTMDPEGYSLKREGQRIILSTKEFEVLRHLVRNPGKALTPDEIYEDVWGTVYGDLTAVAVYIRRIRLKIEEDPKNPMYIQTIHGHGYRFNPDMMKG
jgi:two-component system response regulator RegX3